MDVDALAEALTELGASLRRIALALGFLAVRVSSSSSDTVVVSVPRGLRRFKIEPPTGN